MRRKPVARAWMSPSGSFDLHRLSRSRDKTLRKSDIAIGLVGVAIGGRPLAPPSALARTANSDENPIATVTLQAACCFTSQTTSFNPLAPGSTRSMATASGVNTA